MSQPFLARATLDVEENTAQILAPAKRTKGHEIFAEWYMGMIFC
jgi:hypothetical protein